MRTNKSIRGFRRGAAAPKTPVTPETPDTPVTHDTPDTPETPETPDPPVTPDTSVTPATPDTPVTPVTPEGRVYVRQKTGDINLIRNYPKRDSIIILIIMWRGYYQCMMIIGLS